MEVARCRIRGWSPSKRPKFTLLHQVAVLTLTSALQALQLLRPEHAILNTNNPHNPPRKPHNPPNPPMRIPQPLRPAPNPIPRPPAIVIVVLRHFFAEAGVMPREAPV